MHSPPLKLLFGATETAVKPLSVRLSLALSLSLQLGRRVGAGGVGGGEARGSGNEASVSMRCEGLSALHTADLCHLLPPLGGSDGGRGAKPGGQ